MSKFNWGTASKISAALELRKRDVTRELYKSSALICLVCGKRPEMGETVYYPATGLPSTNKVIAHKDCVDRACTEHSAKSASEFQQLNSVAKGVIAMPVIEASTRKDGLGYLKGWQDGAKYFAEKKVDEEWIKGFFEGMVFMHEQKEA